MSVPGLDNQRVVDVTYNVRGPYDVFVTTRETYGSKLTVPWPLESKVVVPPTLVQAAPGGHGGRGGVTGVGRVRVEVRLVAARRHGLADRGTHREQRVVVGGVPVGAAGRIVPEASEQRDGRDRKDDDETGDNASSPGRAPFTGRGRNVLRHGAPVLVAIRRAAFTVHLPSPANDEPG